MKTFRSILEIIKEKAISIHLSLHGEPQGYGGDLRNEQDQN